MPDKPYPGLSDIESIDFWKMANPGLTISKKPFSPCAGKEYVCDPSLADRMRLQMIEDGYFQTPPLLDEHETATLRDAVKLLHSRSIMPIFTAMYDEYWQMLYRLKNLFSSFLLPGYRLIPDFWIWHVNADEQHTGWSPHRDGSMEFSSIRNDGTPTLCTVWVALTDVKTTNSCMYILPRKHDAIFQDFIRRKFGQPGIPDAQKMPIPLQHLRALPIDAGAMIGWDTNLFHWGSASSKWADEPRISAGIYYQASDSTHLPPAFDDAGRRFIDCTPETTLGFNDRLRIIANILGIYIQKFDRDGERDENLTQAVRDFHAKWRKA